jgi:hypothetical protein
MLASFNENSDESRPARLRHAGATWLRAPAALAGLPD